MAALGDAFIHQTLRGDKLKRLGKSHGQECSITCGRGASLGSPAFAFWYILKIFSGTPGFRGLQENSRTVHNTVHFAANVSGAVLLHKVT